MSKDLNYGSYLKLEELLSLQHALSDEHDELQFIIVHQVAELWFKLILYELEAARASMLEDDAGNAVRLMRRVVTIQRIFIDQFDVIETMRPRDFLRFRQRLEPASGFQSVQFREMEIISGSGDERYIPLYGRQPGARERLEQRFKEPTLWDAFLAVLRARAVAVEDEKSLMEALLAVAKGEGDPLVQELAEVLLEYDETFSLWRIRHVKMTERVIGARVGTGKSSLDDLVKTGYSVMGSGGVDYLRSTLDKRFFPLLWEVRTYLMV